MPAPSVPDYGRSTWPTAPVWPQSVRCDRLSACLRFYVLLLVDGLGRHQLGRYAGALTWGRRITRGSQRPPPITSLGTGLPPGRHGIAGYSFWYPPERRVLTTLRWPSGLSGLDVQPQLTYLERLEGAGVRTSTVAPAHFAGTGLTTAALRGPSFRPVTDETDHARRLDLVTQAVASAERTLTYCYERRLDHAGHSHGVGSPQWLAELARRPPAGVLHRPCRRRRLVVTGDHGMVDVPADARYSSRTNLCCHPSPRSRARDAHS